MEPSRTNFVKQYEPGTKARVELVNGRILDVVNGCYFDAGTSVILQGGKIETMPGRAVESRVPVDFTIDLQGKTLLPSLYNTHLHFMLAGATTMVFGLSDMWRSRKYREQQIARHMAECLAHGITHVRPAHPAGRCCRHTGILLTGEKFSDVQVPDAKRRPYQRLWGVRGISHKRG
jgi:hypothetical protein